MLRSIIAEPALRIDALGIVDADHPAVAFFERALAKDPEQRFGSAAEMADALRTLAASFSRARSKPRAR